MTGGFWAGSIPPWAYAAFACACLLFLCVGELDGWRRGAREAREDAEWEAKARRTRPVYRERTMIPVEYRPAPVPGLGTAIWARSPEVAHEAWLAHEEQALAIANDRPEVYPPGHPLHDWDPSCRERGCPVHGNWDQPEPDLRTDSQWTADMAADMTRWLDGLLNANPVTEEL